MKSLYVVLLAFLSMSSFANETPLVERMKALDTALFESFNHCQDPEELSKHTSYFAVDVEFYHDNGGVTRDRNTMISNTSKNACGSYTHATSKY